jgi:hypothetical protein
MCHVCPQKYPPDTRLKKNGVKIECQIPTHKTKKQKSDLSLSHGMTHPCLRDTHRQRWAGEMRECINEVAYLIRLRRLQNGAGQRQQEFEFLQYSEHMLDAIGLRLARQHRTDELCGRCVGD